MGQALVNIGCEQQLKEIMKRVVKLPHISCILREVGYSDKETEDLLVCQRMQDHEEPWGVAIQKINKE